ncbi:hypothetical protein HDU67_009281 [Dinochytrium kinnereticum]|nr:hypothetical protein HDU67_009281 [Dinochytrium kinnereticum]
MKDYLMGIIAYASFLCFTSTVAIAFRIYHLIRIFNKTVQDDALNECIFRNDYSDGECRNALNMQVAMFATEDVIVMICAIYFTLVVVEYARDFKKDPDQYTNSTLFPTYYTTGTPPPQSFIVYTNGGQPGAYPPQRPVDPYAVDLPQYQPPLPNYENVPKTTQSQGNGTQPVFSARPIGNGEELQPPSVAVSRETTQSGPLLRDPNRD